MSEQATTETVETPPADAPETPPAETPEPVAEAPKPVAGWDKGLQKTQQRLSRIEKENLERHDELKKMIEGIAKGSGIELPAPPAPAPQQQTDSAVFAEMERQLATLQRERLFDKMRSPAFDPEATFDTCLRDAFDIIQADPEEELTPAQKVQLNNATWKLFNKQADAAKKTPQPAPNAKKPIPPRTPAPPSPGGASVAHNPATRVPMKPANPFEITDEDRRKLVGKE